jgi:hypothetical protein
MVTSYPNLLAVVRTFNIFQKTEYHLLCVQSFRICGLEIAFLIVIIITDEVYCIIE